MKTTETTASQPKSIGDDAQFRKLMLNFLSYPTATLPLRGQPEYRAVAEFIDSRPPAAQASATIQAAALPAERAPNSSDPRDEAHAAGWNACLAEIRSAATIQEPVMVAEPGLRNSAAARKHAERIDNMHKGVVGALAAIKAEHEAAGNQSSPGVSTPRAGQNMIIGAMSQYPAAPMAADPAGVAVIERAIRFIGTGSHTQIARDTMMNELRKLLKSATLATTVKAVPSEALDAARYRWLRFADLDALAAANWPGGEVFTGEDFDKAIDAAMNFAAPLADKTGGGE